MPGFFSIGPSAVQVPYMLLRRFLHSIPSRLAKMSYPVPSNERVQDLKENIEAIKAEMAKASSSTASQRKPTLVLVSKLKPPSDLMAAYQNLEENDRHFGENYVQEVGFQSASNMIFPQ